MWPDFVSIECVQTVLKNELYIEFCQSSRGLRYQILPEVQGEILVPCYNAPMQIPEN
jgi:hypothetical protein